MPWTDYLPVGPDLSKVTNAPVGTAISQGFQPSPASYVPALGLSSPQDWKQYGKDIRTSSYEPPGGSNIRSGAGSAAIKRPQGTDIAAPAQFASTAAENFWSCSPSSSRRACTGPRYKPSLGPQCSRQASRPVLLVKR